MNRTVASAPCQSVSMQAALFIEKMKPFYNSWWYIFFSVCVCVCWLSKRISSDETQGFYVDALNGKMRTLKDDLHVICRT